MKTLELTNTKSCLAARAPLEGEEMAFKNPGMYLPLFSAYSLVEKYQRFIPGLNGTPEVRMSVCVPFSLHSENGVQRHIVFTLFIEEW